MWRKIICFNVKAIFVKRGEKRRHSKAIAGLFNEV